MSSNQYDPSGFGFREYKAPLDNAKKGSLIFTNGAAMVRVFADIITKDLYSAYFDGLLPEIKSMDGTVAIEYAYNFQFKKVQSPRGKILLNGSIPWEIVMLGWVYETTFNLKELNLSRLDIHAGVRDMEIILPVPTDNIPIHISGGISSVTISRPAGTEIRAVLKNGAEDLSIDHKNYEKTDNKIEKNTSHYDQVSERYDIQISGGVSNMKFDSY